MKATVLEIFDNLLLRFPCLTSCKQEILKAYELMEDTYRNGGKILV
jgi:D-sedoheptulose 7-phosphate isomerase